HGHLHQVVDVRTSPAERLADIDDAALLLRWSGRDRDRPLLVPRGVRGQRDLRGSDSLRLRSSERHDGDERTSGEHDKATPSDLPETNSIETNGGVLARR